MKNVRLSFLLCGIILKQQISKVFRLFPSSECFKNHTSDWKCTVCAMSVHWAKGRAFKFSVSANISNINKPDSCKKLSWIQLWLRQSKGAWSSSGICFHAVMHICSCRIDSEKVCSKLLTVTWYSYTRNISSASNVILAFLIVFLN